MKLLILINNKNNKYHNELANKFLKIFNEADGQVIDLSSGKPLHEIFYEIKAYKADVIITVDFAGFELVTEDDTLSLNNIHARIVNVLLHGVDCYKKELKYRQNLSMFTYLSKRGIDNVDDFIKAFRKNHPQIPNVDWFCHYDYEALDVKELERNDANLHDWSYKMIKDIRI